MKYIVSVIVTFFMLTTAAVAQSDTADMLKQWATTAARAEVMLEASRASTPFLETLRGELAGQRDQAAALEQESRERIVPLREQLAALAVDADSEEFEAPEITARRKELSQEIARASVPLLVAQAAFKRADGLIKRVDTVIRDRFSEQLVALGPSPLNPTLLPVVLEDLKHYGSRVYLDLSNTMKLERNQTALKQKIPLALFIAGIGLWMLLGLRRQFADLIHRALTYGSEIKLWEAALANLARLIVPIASAVALISAIHLSGLVGSWGRTILSVLPWVAVSLVAGPWLGRSIFGVRDPNAPVTNTANAGYRLSIVLGVVFALQILLDAVANQGQFRDESRAVLTFPLILIGSIALFRLAGLIRNVIPVAEGAEEGHESSVRMIAGILARIVFVISLSAPVLAGVGYFAAAKFLVFPTIVTLGFLATLRMLFDLIRAFLDRWIEGESSELRRDQVRLVPVFAGFVLTLGAIPMLALIWGARISDLSEAWHWLNEGVAIGNSQFSLSDLLVFVLVFGVGYTVTRLTQKAVRNSVLPRTRLDIGGRTAILAGIGYSGIFLSALAAVSATGLDLSSLAIVAGALSVGIGFGLQTIVSNFVSGIILLIERPIKEGDWIRAGGHEGVVRKISVRATLVDTFDRRAVIIPNSELIAGSVENYTSPDKTGRLRIPIGVAYGTDPHKIREILLGIADAHSDTLKYPAPSVVFKTFGASALDFELRCFLRDINNMMGVQSDINFEIARIFEEEGIEIPYDQSEITLKNIDEIGEVVAKILKEGK